MSIVVQRMARHRRLAFSVGRFRISLKRFYPTLMLCLSLGDENTMWR